MSVTNTENISKNHFRFKQFDIRQEHSAMKINTDGVLLGAWTNATNASTILDIGTGTGVIALMLAQKNDTAQIDAVEIDEASAAEAQHNAAQSPWANRLQVHQTAIQDFAKNTTTQFDLIVSNPPFFTGGVIATKESRNTARNTVRLPNGDLLLAVRLLLSPKGRFTLVLPLLEGLRFREMAQSTYGLFCTKTTEVRSKPSRSVERLLMEFAKEPAAEQKDAFIIQEENSDDWTEAYINLTKDFYLHL